ncbi:MAG TPA: hypothetical protein VH165_09575, partial [Kofleriaceae bacterium]|nr:hypothetical protein [Kofleriaceae bacterium]
MLLGCARHEAVPADPDRDRPSATPPGAAPLAPLPPEVALQILGETSRLRISDPTPATSPWFDGTRVALTAARGEILGLQVVHRDRQPVTLAWPGGAPVQVRGYAVEPLEVVRVSTALYGGSHGAGWYAEGLAAAAAPASDPAYFEVEVARDAAPGVIAGELRVAGRVVPVALTVAPVTLPRLPIRVWAYDNAVESIWDRSDERACSAMFRSYGVLLSPDVHYIDWPERRAGLADGSEIRDVPVWIPDYPPLAGAAVKAWIAAFRGTGQVPFAIPIDEP